LREWIDVRLVLQSLEFRFTDPGRFIGELHARGWLEPFFGWHNNAHHHSNLALFTPADVFFGRIEQVRVIRQAALDAAHAVDSATGSEPSQLTGPQHEAKRALVVITSADGLGRGPEGAVSSGTTIPQPRDPLVKEAALAS
jgi:hypothetical protein